MEISFRFPDLISTGTASRRQKPLDFSFWIQWDEKQSSPHADTSPLIHLLLQQGRKNIGGHVRPPWSQDGQFLKYEGMKGLAGWGCRSPGKTGQLVWTGLGQILGPGPYGRHPGLKQWNDQGWLWSVVMFVLQTCCGGYNIHWCRQTGGRDFLHLFAQVGLG